MPRKGPWKPPVYVGPPDEVWGNVDSSNGTSSNQARTSGTSGNGAKCDTCFDLDLHFIPQPHKDPNICSIGQVARHWIKSTDLARNQACQSCSFLKSAFDTLLKNGEVIDIPYGSEVQYSIAILDRNDSDTAGDEAKKRRRDAALAYEPSNGLLVEMRCNTRSRGVKDKGFQEEFKVEIYTRPGAPSAAAWKSIGTAGEVPLKPSAQECAKIIESWLNDCNQNHFLCRQNWQAGMNNGAELLPRRVLDLSNANVRLIESTPGQRDHYVALSHCWGKLQILTTTRDTIEQRKKGIPWDQLPKTFQDAIAITRALGLRYIWIDSLCIIQQDKLDWEEQSAVMADIYSRCYLNIATTRAAGGHVGCLEERWTVRDSLEWAARFSREVSRGRSKKSEEITKTRKSPVRSFKIPGVEQDVYIRLAMESSHEALQTPRWIRSHANTAPLLPRGWVYQERFLSARTIHMHANEMVWVCNVVQRCECRSLDGTPHDGDGWSASKDRLLKLRDTENKAIHGLWRTIVEDFTLLDLTYETDRLPALGGLAYRFAEYLPRNERYLAGLWEGDLVRDLLWESGGSMQTAGPTRQRKGAPSWSWASITWGGEDVSAIDWEYETKPKLVKWAATTTYHQDPRTKIVNVTVDVDGANKYGIVKAGCITLEGALCGIVLKNSRYSKPSSLANVPTISSGVFNSLHMNYDTPNAEASAGGIVYCLFIGSFWEVFDDNPEPHIKHQGLMLRVMTNGKFERVGRWTQHIEDWVHQKDVWTKKSPVHQVSII